VHWTLIHTGLTLPTYVHAMTLNIFGKWENILRCICKTELRLVACTKPSPYMRCFLFCNKTYRRVYVQSDVTELNWHGLVFDELTAHWSLVDAYVRVVT